MTDHPPAGNPPGIYIHIPFCARKCGYCGFASTTDRTLIPAFLTALGREAHSRREKWNRFDTLYIGGGTPSVLTADDLGRVVDTARSAFETAPAAEITVEVNPGDIDAAYLRRMRTHGVNRLSIGCQSFDDRTLTFLGRRHTARQGREAVHLAREAGFDNIGIDLIYGIPGQSLFCWQKTLGEALSLAPDHLSCYQLTIEEQTPLAERSRRGEVTLPGDALQADFFLMTSRVLAEGGYDHYEVSNFARLSETESRHNKKYWNHTPYLGLGPAAHSFDGRRRWWNTRSVDAYVRELAAGRTSVAASELLTPDQLRTEALFLGLRTRQGVDLADFKRRFGSDLVREKGGILKTLAEEGLVEIRDCFLRPTRAGMAVADSLALI
ncbi:MAG: radical SAM family heme chaperone HemW [Syntrophales bacterium]